MWHKEDKELFTDSIDILNAIESIYDLKTIPQKSDKMHFYSDELCISWSLADISDIVGDKK